MSLELAIIHKGMIKKALPLSVILGDELRYGCYDDTWRLEDGKLGEREFTAYLPDSLGRGFTVIWKEGEKRNISMRLLTPTCRDEIRAFYQTVRRVMDYWNASLEVEGEKVDLDEWLAGMDDYIDFNTRALHSFCQPMGDGEQDSMTLFSAYWPLEVGKEDALRFADDIDAFEAWLHEKQSIDAYYASPRFFRVDGASLGRYVISEDVRSIFPKKPSVPFGMIDFKTNKLLKCDNYRVGLYCPSLLRDDFVGDVCFEEFWARVPQEKVSEYDCGHCLIEPLTAEELKAILGE